MSDILLSDIIAPAYYGLFEKTKLLKVHDVLLKGGRGSGKSSFAAEAVIYIILRYKFLNAVVYMKHAIRLRTGAFSLYCAAIQRLGLSDKFEIRLSPMQITRKATGQKILFRGCDDPNKSKGITSSDADKYFGILHFEEIDQFDGLDEINKLKDSVLRGGDDYLVISCFNPPKNKFHWCNQWAQKDISGRVVLHTTYLDMPKKWLGRAFIDRAEALKDYDYDDYANRYLGEVTGYGDTVFDDIEFREITDAEIDRFDNIFQGFDWGWFPDPAVFVRLHYDEKARTVYIIDEIVNNKRPIESYAMQIIDRGYSDFPLTIDGAIPEHEYRFRQSGINAISAVKGAGSIELGLNWLENKHFVVDEKRTPFTCGELRCYEYETLASGEYTGRYSAVNNHSIDAIRYSLLDYIRRYGDFLYA